MPDLFKHGVSVEELAAIGLFDAAPQSGPQFGESGFPGLLALLEQSQAFANDLARGLIPARGDARFDEPLYVDGSSQPNSCRPVNGDR